MKSNCCNVSLKVLSATEGTAHYECEKCGKACDVQLVAMSPEDFLKVINYHENLINYHKNLWGEAFKEIMTLKLTIKRLMEENAALKKPPHDNEVSK
jgi:hypothetical protein